MKKTVKDVEVEGKRVLVRVDFNVPIENGTIIDDARIRAGLPTLRYLIDQRARVILLTHLGQPGGFVVESLRTNPLAARLADLLGQPVAKVNNCIGPEVQDAVKSLEPGQVLMLENVRFHPGEVVNDAHFAERLASIADLYVDDAFAAIHRLHASIVGVARYIPAVAGLLVEKELQGLNRVRSMIQPPIVSVLGGVRLVEKAHFIDDNLENHIPILLGGVLANTFLKAKDLEVGQSTIEAQVVGLARGLLADSLPYLNLPTDVVVADSLSPQAKRRVVSIKHVPPTGYIVDIGPDTIQHYAAKIERAKTVIWNGLLGIGSEPPFSAGSEVIARKIAALPNAVKIIGGGNTIGVLNRLGLADRMDYLSFGGAAFLDALEREPLAGIEVLQDKTAEKAQPENTEPEKHPDSAANRRFDSRR